MKQINCKHFKSMLVDALYNYDQLPGEDKHMFHAHLTTCPACAGEYEKMAGVLALMDQRQEPEIGEEYWDSYYPRLMEKLKNQEKASLIKSFWESRTLFSKRVLAVGDKNGINRITDSKIITKD